MAETVITLRILRKGARGEAVLDRFERELRNGSVGPPESRVVEVRMPGRGPRAWDEVREALDAAGSDWREWIYLSPRPTR